MKPIEYYRDVIDRCKQTRAIYVYLSQNVTAVVQIEELLRAEWVTLLSALDLYVHELVIQNMLEVFGGARSPTAPFGNFVCSLETTMRIKRATNHIDALSAFELEVRSRLERQSFQRPDQIADAVRLISNVELWNEVAIELGATQKNKSNASRTIKRNLSIIADRRNKIVHEGDLQPISPRTKWPISLSDVEDVSSLIEKIVPAIDKVVR